MSPSILFLSTTNLTCNPRILKEINSARKEYEAHFVGFKIGNWSDKNDSLFLKDLDKTDFRYLSATRKPFLPWLLSSIAELISRKIWHIYRRSLFLSAIAHSKRTLLLLAYLLLHRDEYRGVDLIVCHTLGTLYPGYLLSKLIKTKFTFDVEDYHPGEKTDKDEDSEKKRREYLMSEILKGASLLTFASDMIGEKSLNLLKPPYPFHFTVLNGFDSREFAVSEGHKKEIDLVWFSQNIGFGRGLELLIPLMEEFDGRFRLNLIGNMDRQFHDSVICRNDRVRDFIRVFGPMPQRKLNRAICEFDVGLALELATSDFNRELTLTNKLIAYCQAGLFILATDTAAQRQFLQEHPFLGSCVSQDRESMSFALKRIYDDIAHIRERKLNRFEYARRFSWENESRKLSEAWDALVVD